MTPGCYAWLATEVPRPLAKRGKGCGEGDYEHTGAFCRVTSTPPTTGLIYAALLGIDAPEAFKRRFRGALIELDFNDALTPNYYSD
jgi:hypothetical protein